MAKDKDAKQEKGGKDEKKKAPEKKSGGSPLNPFAIGLLVGLLLGVAMGWWFRPPESFPLDRLRTATERKFLDAQDQSREALADFAEDLARRLRAE